MNVQQAAELARWYSKQHGVSDRWGEDLVQEACLACLESDGDANAVRRAIAKYHKTERRQPRCFTDIRRSEHFQNGNRLQPGRTTQAVRPLPPFTFIDATTAEGVASVQRR